jgi:hypothetical protein
MAQETKQNLQETGEPVDAAKAMALLLQNLKDLDYPRSQKV